MRKAIAITQSAAGLRPGGDDGVLDGRVIIDEHPELDLLQDNSDPRVGEADPESTA